MKEKHKEKNYLSNKHKKSKKKHKKKYESSSDSDSSDCKMKWVEASVYEANRKVKKKKKQKKKHMKSSSSNSESDGDRMQWVEASSSNSKLEKKKKHNKNNSSSSSDSESNCEYSMTKSLPNKDMEKRETWMNEESFVPTLSKDEMYSSSCQKRADSMKEQKEKEEKIQKERELNPYWRNEGIGLPEKEASIESLSLPSTSVGDGGYSWLKKAYYRIQEQAQSEGRSMEEIAVERWGSLSKLIALIEEAEERMKSHPDWKNLNPYKHKHNQDNKSSRAQFRKPSCTFESEKSFDSPFQFKKPVVDIKNRQLLNQFKSSRKSNYMSFNQLDQRTEKYDNFKNLHKEHSSEHEKQHLKFQKINSDRECLVPAWKKPKYAVEKTEDTGMSNNPECEIGKSMKEICNIKDNASVMDNVPVMYSEEDLSKLAAKQIKAEIMGDISLAQKFKEQLDEARRIVKEKGFAKRPSKQVEEVILTKIDNQGQARPIQTTQEKIADYKQKKQNKYFDDGCKHSLKQMFEREKLMTSDDQMEMFIEASSQSNETAEIDYESGHISKKLSKKLSSTREEERDIGKAIKQHQKLTASLERCIYCLDQPRIKKYLIVDVGEQIYLCLPNYQTLTEGHCLIVPKMHVSSFLSLDENEWREVNDFKNEIRNMFKLDNKSIIFLETSMNFRNFPHAVLECIPVPKEEGDMAPFYFKKAIQEAEAEWAHNKKLIDLTNKGLRNSVPKNLPYFHVEFDTEVHAGYAHVIEDEKYFPQNFGKEVVGGMLDIDYNYLYKNKKEDPLKKSKEVVEFQKRWKKFRNVKS